MKVIFEVSGCNDCPFKKQKLYESGEDSFYFCSHPEIPSSRMGGWNILRLKQEELHPYWCPIAEDRKPEFVPIPLPGMQTCYECFGGLREEIRDSCGKCSGLGYFKLKDVKCNVCFGNGKYTRIVDGINKLTDCEICL